MLKGILTSIGELAMAALVAELNALMESDLLDEKDKVFIDAALNTVIHDEVEQIGAIEAGGSRPR